MSKIKKYGFPYDYSGKKPLYRFSKGDVEFIFYEESKGYTVLQKSKDRQQRVALDDLALNNMLGMLDKNGFRQISI